MTSDLQQKRREQGEEIRDPEMKTHTCTHTHECMHACRERVRWIEEEAGETDEVGRSSK